MTTITIQEAQATLSDLIHRLSAGDEVTITENDQPMAKLTPTRSAERALLNPAAVRYISTATIWEIAIKYGKGRLPLSLPYRQWMEKAIADLVLDVLPITLDHAEFQSALPFHHRDPFDRLLASQALLEGIPLISGDAIFDAYGVSESGTEAGLPLA